jgi:O-antigen ligase
MDRIYIKNFFYFSLILFPLTYPIGIFVTELFLIMFILFFLINNRDKNYFQDRKIIYLLFVSFYFGISAFIQIDDNLMISSIFYFRYIIFSLAIFFFFDFFEDTEEKKKNIAILLFIIFIFLIILDGLFQFSFGKNLLGFEIKKNRISGIFDTELILGSYLIKVLPLITWFMFYKNLDFYKNTKILAIFFSTYFLCIFITGERASFALALLFIILMIFFVKPLKKIFIFSLLNSFIALIIIFFFNFGKTDPINRIFIKTFNQITNQYYNIDNRDTLVENKGEEKTLNKKKTLIFSEDHHGHYLLAFDIFKKNLIFGVGPKGFRHYCRSIDYDPPIGICSTHPHNYLIQIAAETGLVGLALFSYVIFFIIAKFIKCYNSKISENNKFLFNTITIGILINLFPLVPSGNFFNNWISIINYYFLGIYFYCYNKLYR